MTYKQEVHFLCIVVICQKTGSKQEARGANVSYLSAIPFS